MRKLKDVKIGVSQVLILCLIFLVVGAGLGYATSPTQPFTINRGVYPNAPSFTIWSEGDTCFAKNQYGVLVHSVTGGDAAATVIQLAIDNGESILVSAGTYYITTNLAARSNVEVKGQGISTKLVAATDAITIFDGSSINNFTLSDMWLQGYGSGLSACIYFIGTSFSTFRNLRITNAGIHGLFLQTNCYNNKILDNEVSYNGYAGICLSGGTAPNEVVYTIIKGNYAFNNGWHGIQIGERSHNTIIADNICTHNGVDSPGDGAGIMVGTSTGSNVVGNVCYNNTNAGIWLEDSTTFCVISENTIYSEAAGIYLYGVSNNNIEGNTLRGNGVSEWSDGIILYHTASDVSQNNLIQNNLIYNFGRDGIQISGTLANSFNTFSNNKLLGNKRYGIAEEIDSANYNLFIGNYANGNVIGNIWVHGANSEVHCCFNGTSWIT